jgi:hypothetical protein
MMPEPPSPKLIIQGRGSALPQYSIRPSGDLIMEVKKSPI